ncbi:MAG: hypothetical protein HY693_03065, partial [Deltaproteobacteria bacterium]|nr:hypothetical protein [Deltaproteobacteria bacterium]
MDKLINLLNNFYINFHEPIWIIILFAGIVILSLILTYLFEEKAELKKEDSLPRDMPPFEVTPLTPEPEPPTDNSQEGALEDKYTETEPVLDKSSQQSVMEQIVLEESERSTEELEVYEKEPMPKPEVVSDEDRYALEKAIVEPAEEFEVPKESVKEIPETKESLFSA